MLNFEERSMSTIRFHITVWFLALALTAVAAIALHRLDTAKASPQMQMQKAMMIDIGEMMKTIDVAMLPEEN
jgi:hypothetical protein